MSAVLQAIDTATEVLRIKCDTQSVAELTQARAAVAELIEAAKEMEGAHLTDVDLFNAQPRLRVALIPFEATP